METVTRLYDRLEDAAAAAEALLSEGFDRDGISLISPHAREDFDPTSYGEERLDPEGENDPRAGAAVGAGVGAALGGTAGLLMGLGLLIVPGIGPALALGPLASAALGAGIGGASGGLAGALMRVGIPAAESNEYSDAVRRGSTLLLARVPQERVYEAGRVLDSYGPIPMRSGEAAAREGGHEWPESAAAAPTDAEVDAARRRTFDEDV